jgi:arginine decarboxylase
MEENTNHHHFKEWTARQAEEFYGFKRWGGGHFSVNDKGFVCVDPMGDGRKIALWDVLEEAHSKKLYAPLVVRFQDLLHKRVIQLNEAFRKAISQENYNGRYRGVFPIKVNQLREVVEEILEAGEKYDYGIEVGSKPELLIALALHNDTERLLICNGYKDEEYIRMALTGRKLGKEIILVVEQPSELPLILKISKELKVDPLIGIRVKLSASGEGKWASSSGEDAKFGLTIPEILLAVQTLKKNRMGQSLCLLHFHIGSQIPSIITIKKAVAEATHCYCQLAKMGFPMKYLDVGGGLGVDYDGSRSNFDSSTNYSMEEYARDVVFNVKEICSNQGIDVPNLVSESGRAVVAPHSLLIVEVVDRISKIQTDIQVSKRRKIHPIIKDLQHILKSARSYSRLERFHDALQKKEEAISLFNLGYLDLESRALAESLFWRICEQIRDTIQESGFHPEDLQALRRTLADQYVCNFSVFQSLLDHWACQQLFPITPIHRLDERPTVDTILVDITCDSEGKITQFIDLEDVQDTIALHPLEKNKPYYLAIYLTGAYQDIMGDLHNLFGRVNEVHVFLEEDEDDGFYIEESIQGSRVSEVIQFIQYNVSDMCRLMKKQVDKATRNDLVKPREGIGMLDLFESMIKGNTYLTPSAQKKRKKK